MDVRRALALAAGGYPLTYPFPLRTPLLKGYGNAIVPEVAAQFLGTVEEVIREAVTGSGAAGGVA